MALVGAGCASRGPFVQAPDVTPAPLLPGTRWQYQRVNRYNGLEIEGRLCELEQAAPELVVLWRGPGGDELARERYVDAWRVIEEPQFAEPVRYEDPVPVTPPGFRAGARLRVETRYKAPGSPRWLRWRTDLFAPGWQQIVVPAGTFTALRIERTHYFEPWQFTRFSARREETLWYAPAVGRWVRRDWTGYFKDETTLGGSGPLAANSAAEEREESVSWRLAAYEPAPVSG